MSAPTGVCPQTHTAITFLLYLIVFKKLINKFLVKMQQQSTLPIVK